MNPSPKRRNWLRRYVIIGAVIILASTVLSLWGYHRAISSPGQGGWNSYRFREITPQLAPYFLFVVLLLVPWWRVGRGVCAIGYTLLLLITVFLLWFTIAAFVHHVVRAPVLIAWLVGYITVVTAQLAWLGAKATN